MPRSPHAGLVLGSRAIAIPSLKPPVPPMEQPTEQPADPPKRKSLREILQERSGRGVK